MRVRQSQLEKHASATAVTAMARLMQLGEELSSREVYEIAKQDTGKPGDKAREIWRIVRECLGIALATLINTFNFPLCLLSGGMLPAWELFAPKMLKTVERRSFTYVHGPLSAVARSKLHNSSGLTYRAASEIIAVRTGLSSAWRNRGSHRGGTIVESRAGEVRRPCP